MLADLKLSRSVFECAMGRRVIDPCNLNWSNTKLFPSYCWDKPIIHGPTLQKFANEEAQ